MREAASREAACPRGSQKSWWREITHSPIISIPWKPLTVFLPDLIHFSSPLFFFPSVFSPTETQCYKPRSCWGLTKTCKHLKHRQQRNIAGIRTEPSTECLEERALNGSRATNGKNKTKQKLVCRWRKLGMQNQGLNCNKMQATVSQKFLEVAGPCLQSCNPRPGHLL